MKVLILTLGTRGDVQPFVTLAQGLTDAGHEAVLAAPHRFAGFVRERGVTFAGIDDGPMRLMDHSSGSGTVVGDVATGGLGAKLALAKRMPAMFTDVLEDCWVAAEGPGAGADVLVHNGQVIAGQHVAERLAIPAVLALPIPLYVPTREFPWPGAATPTWLPPALNRATYLGMRGPAMMFGRTVDRWRDTTLGLHRRRGRHDPCRRPDGSPALVLHGISRHVLPRPTDWPATATMTGYWFATVPVRPQQLPDALTRFLDAGEPPVFVGFGSMAGPDPDATTTTVLDAARRAGARVVLGTGWGGLAATPSDHAFVIDDVPYEHLFPHVDAIVHHGGAGTIAAAAAAGRPQVVCPFVADQPFWGRRMHDLGVATEPIHQRHLSADRLAQAIHTAMTDAGLADAAANLGTRIRAEHGLDTAVRQLENVVEADQR